jgi:ATP-dependent Clp protease adaptor protein ClpS
METDILEIVESETTEKVVKTSKLIAHNNDYTSFDEAIDTLMKYCKHTFEQAEQCANIIHTKGSCVVKEGDFDTLKPMCEGIRREGIYSEII